MTILIDPYRFGAGSGGGFTDPTDFAGLQLWLAADVAGLGTGAVTTWPDQSGQGHDATGQGTTKPAKVANVVNGLPVIRFNGSTSYFTLPDYMGGFTASTWFATLKLDNYPTVSEGTAGLFTMDTSSSSTFYPYPGAGIFLGYGTTDRYGIFDPGTSLSAWHRLIITVDSQRRRYSGKAVGPTTSMGTAWSAGNTMSHWIRMTSRRWMLTSPRAWDHERRDTHPASHQQVSASRIPPMPSAR